MSSQTDSSEDDIQFMGVSIKEQQRALSSQGALMNVRQLNVDTGALERFHSLVMTPRSFEAFANKVRDQQAQKSKQEWEDLMRTQIHNMRVLMTKIRIALQKLFIFMGFMVVIYGIVDVLVPGTWQKHIPIMRQHMTHVLSHMTNDMNGASMVRTQGVIPK